MDRTAGDIERIRMAIEHNIPFDEIDVLIIEKTSEERGMIYTTYQYLDCNCVALYVHPVARMPRDLEPATYVICDRCETVFEDAPDSRVNEVLFFGFSVDSSTVEIH